MKVFVKKSRIPVISILFLALFLAIESYEPAYPGAETATYTGKVISVKLGPWVPFINRSATLVIEDSRGTHYTVHAGVKTSYFPHRTPQLGDRLTVNCVKDEGLWAATTITYK